MIPKLWQQSVCIDFYVGNLISLYGESKIGFSINNCERYSCIKSIQTYFFALENIDCKIQYILFYTS